MHGNYCPPTINNFICLLKAETRFMTSKRGVVVVSRRTSKTKHASSYLVLEIDWKSYEHPGEVLIVIL